MSSPFLKDQTGSVSVLMLSVVPLVFLIVLCFTFTGYLIQIKSRVRSTCVIQSIEIQKNVILAERTLFALNPLSTSLRLQLIMANLELAASIVPPNPAAFASATTRINSIKYQQQQLDRLQKATINFAKLKAKADTLKLVANLHQHFHESGSVWSHFLTATNSLQVKNHISISVKPDIEEVAPNYELTSNYKSTQALVLTWQHLFRTKEQAQKLLNTTNSFDFSCGSSPHKKGDKWHIEIKGDKF